MSAKKLPDDGGSMTREFVLTNKLGLHLRPAAVFVKVASGFRCDIFVTKDQEKVNGKSIMGLLMLGVGPGNKMKVQAEGSDAPQALAALEKIFHPDHEFNNV
jgi:phosphocarrier protein HPr